MESTSYVLSFRMVFFSTLCPRAGFLTSSYYVRVQFISIQKMFVDSASRLQRPYGAWNKSASAIFSVVKRFVADMAVPRAFRTDNGAKYTNSMFVDLL